MSAKVEISMEKMLSIVHEVNTKAKKIEDFASEMNISKRTLQRNLTDSGFMALRGYNLWSAPNETKEETLKKYHIEAPEEPKAKTPRREVLSAPKQKTTPTERTKKTNKPQKTKRLNIDIDQLTFVKLKVISVKNDTTMTDIVSKLIKEYIDNYQGDI